MYLVFLKSVQIRCHQEMYQSEMVYPTNVLKILAKKKKGKKTH